MSEFGVYCIDTLLSVGEVHVMKGRGVFGLGIIRRNDQSSGGWKVSPMYKTKDRWLVISHSSRVHLESGPCKTIEKTALRERMR